MAARADPADLARVTFHNGLSEADLAIAGHGDVSIPPHAQDGGAMPPDRVSTGVCHVLHGAPNGGSDAAPQEHGFT